MAALPQQGAAPLAPLRGYPCTPAKTVHPPLASVLFLRVLLSYTATSALIPCPSGTAASTTIPKQSNSVCEKPQTDFAGNTGCPSLRSPTKLLPVPCGWMRKAASPPATMSTVPMCGRRWTSAAHPTIWRTISGARGISLTSPASTGRYACPSMSISQGLIR